MDTRIGWGKDSPVGSDQAKLAAVSLPKGGGAIRGIDEKFSVNPATGTGALTLPVLTTPSRSNFYPKLTLSYDAGAGNGPFGLGWSLALAELGVRGSVWLHQCEPTAMQVAVFPRDESNIRRNDWAAKIEVGGPLEKLKDLFLVFYYSP